jgi:hypothetical protein
MLGQILGLWFPHPNKEKKNIAKCGRRQFTPFIFVRAESFNTMIYIFNRSWVDTRGSSTSHIYTQNSTHNTAVHHTFTHRFLSVGKPKNVTYSVLIKSEEALHQRIFYDCQTIRNRSESSDIVGQSMIRSIHACAVSGGWRFEHFL